MTFETIKNIVPKVKKMSLPGEDAQLIMAPAIRKKALNGVRIEDKNPRNAAVLSLLYPKNEIAHIALILRPIYEGVHSGQIALPGGKVESFDRNYQETALRETWEEVGVPSDQIEVLKTMTKVYIPPSNFWVHPFLGIIHNRPNFKIQIEEVAEIVEVPLSSLLSENNVVQKKITTSYATNIEVPSFKLNGYIVWGATAMMLSELKVFLKGVLD